MDRRNALHKRFTLIPNSVHFPSVIIQHCEYYCNSAHFPVIGQHSECYGDDRCATLECESVANHDFSTGIKCLGFPGIVVVRCKTEGTIVRSSGSTRNDRLRQLRRDNPRYFPNSGSTSSERIFGMRHARIKRPRHLTADRETEAPTHIVKSPPSIIVCPPEYKDTRIL
jgi:hypothetical protein